MRLFGFPREIRDDIYRHFFSRQYRVPSVKACEDIESTKKIGTDDNLLQTSKQVRHEATSVLLRESILRFSTDIRDHFSRPINLSTTNIVQNIEINVNVSIFKPAFMFNDLHYPSSAMQTDSTYIDIVRQLNRAGASRRTFRLKFANPDGHYVCISATDQYLKCFKKIVVEVDYPSSNFSPFRGSNRGARPISDDVQIQGVQNAGRMRAEVDGVLRYFLGTGVLYDILNSRCLEYRPT